MTSEESVPSAEPASEKPFLRVVSGNPTPEELAVLVAVMASAGGSEPEEDSGQPSPWGAPAGMHRIPIVAPGPGTWVQLGRR